MAEFIGSLMVGWPTWLIGIIIIVLTAIIVYLYWTIYFVRFTTHTPFWRKKRGKK